MLITRSGRRSIQSTYPMKISTLYMSHMCVVPGVYDASLAPMNPIKHASRPRATLHSAPRRRRAGRRGAAPRPNPCSRRSFVHTERQLTSHTHTVLLRPCAGYEARARGAGASSSAAEDGKRPDGTDSISTQSPPTVPTRSRVDLREMRGFCFQRERA